MNTELSTKLENLPSTPGVYQFKDSKGSLLYVGKAKILKNRVRQYFQSRPQQSSRLATMISKIRDVEIITTDTEVEALILELNLINELKPKYNVNFKDDKSYPYIVITNEPYPRVFPTRKKRSDGSKYFGPYTDVKNMRFALKSIRDIFMIRSCSLNLTDENISKGKFKVCLDYHIKKCEGPCEGLVSQEDYNLMIDEVAKLLNGKTSSLLKEMNQRMNFYASEMLFEKAAKLRDRINAVDVYSSKQKMVDDEIIDKDIFAFERQDNDGCGMVLKIRDGKVIGKTHFYMNNVLEKADEEILENLLMEYYNKTDFIPDEIYLQNELENPDTVKDWLEKRKSARVDFVIPKIGEKYKLVFMVKKNARLMLDELILSKMKRDFTPPSLDALKRDLKLTKLPRRIECYDISHIQGTDTVASMVVFFDGKPKKSDYRKFKIQSVSNETGQPDDFLSMREVIFRRFKRYVEQEEKQKDESAEGKNENKKTDESFSSIPDLVIIDGGKGQLSSAVQVLNDLGIKGLNIIGLAKRLEEVFLPGDTDAQTIPKTSSGLKLLQRVRDEAHRFAVTFHKSLRDKRTLTSELTSVPGIGEKVAKKLLTQFGSVEMIKEKINSDFATFEKTIGKKLSFSLKNYFFPTT
ncbi:MAG: excinuclease ABC subunit C [Ignavibacteria bacterium]|nr:excinuclease ABC subunit C [Ignavibacteria bacterium]